MCGGIYSSERIRICITVAVHHHHTVYQSWAHVITVATISHRFKATNFDSCHITAKYCVEKNSFLTLRAKHFSYFTVSKKT